MKTTHRFVMTDDYIANVQRMAISQNKTLKFFYQTWWAWWLPRVVIVPSMIVLYLVKLDEQEIAIENANGNSHLKWSAMLQPAIYADGVLIKFSRLAMVWLPDQGLIEGSPADVRKLLAENVKDPTPGS